jgi:hypothetical protein
VHARSRPDAAYQSRASKDAVSPIKPKPRDLSSPGLRENRPARGNTLSCRSSLVWLLACFLACPQAQAHHQAPTHLLQRVSKIFLTKKAALELACQRNPFVDIRGLSLLDKHLGRKEQRNIAHELNSLLRRIVDDERFFLFESLKTSPKLAGLRQIRIEVVLDDHPYAFADPRRRTISFYSGLIREDLADAVASAGPLCSLFKVPFTAERRGQEFELSQLNTVGAALEFVVEFQLLHELAHVVLEHTVVNQKCEESEADRFALDYLYATRNVILMFPKSNLPLDSMWPPYPTSRTPSEANYPSRPDREDQAWRTRVLRNMAFANIASNKLDLLGAIVGTSFLDADVYASNFALDQVLKNGTACHSVAPRSQ